LLYSGVKNIPYATNGYKRYMIIGTKWLEKNKYMYG
jgi:hypothetical protein